MVLSLSRRDKKVRRLEDVRALVRSLPDGGKPPLLWDEHFPLFSLQRFPGEPGQTDRVAPEQEVINREWRLSRVLTEIRTV